MARPLRLEYEGGIYHVLNRGNYRSAIFRSEKTKAAFLSCLGEACEKTGWRIHAWCVMSNHYHLALETPQGNLADGMRWLQGTFATRFNRMRREHGHIFQGRYKSLVVDPGEGLGSLCHYIHLNGVRARVCSIDELRDWRWSSVAWLNSPKNRPGWYEPNSALGSAGGLRDSAAGRRKYCEYLAWLAEDEPARKALCFEQMSKGWAIGTLDFKKELAKEHQLFAASRKSGCDDLAEVKEAVLQERLDVLLKKVARTRKDIENDGKFADWKVALAATLKRRTTATNGWLKDNLAMGSVHEIGRQVAAWRRNPVRKWVRKLR